MAASANPSAGHSNGNNDNNSHSNGGGQENANGGARSSNGGQEDSMARSTQAALRHNPGLSVDWSPEEQSTLENLLTKYSSDTTIVRYAKISQALKDKTVRDVALRCRWMTKKENGKRRKDDHNSSRKSKDKKEKATDSLPKSSQVANRSNVPPYAQSAMSMDGDDGISYKATRDSMESENKIKKQKLVLESELEEDEEYETPFIQEDGVTKSLSNQDMTTTSRHLFGDSEDGFSINIIENMKEEYGLFVWPCSRILAEYVWQQKARFSGSHVVELGAGTSLPGLVAAKVGAEVTLTDDSTRSEVLDNMRRVCVINNLKCKVLGLTWGVWDAPIFSLHPNIIIGADVLYDTRAFDDLFGTVTFLLQKLPESVFITTYHNRSGHHLIEFLMDKWGLKCTKLLDGFSFMPSHKAASLSGNIQLAEIVLDTPS